MVTEQGILGSAAVMSLVSLTAQGGAWGEALPSTQLFFNRCWTRLEGKFKELGVGWGEKGPVDRVRALGQADLGHLGHSQGESRLELQVSQRQTVGL